jgi:DNA-binding NarL/FixJ family response regulator
VAEIRLLRDLLSETLRKRSAIAVAGAAATADEAIAQLEEMAVDIVLLDVHTPQSVDAIRLLAAAACEPRIVAISVPELEPEIIRCAEAGVAGYVTEDAGVAQLVAAVETVARGEMLCSPRVAATLLRRVAALAAERERTGPTARLTSRELEVISLIGQGLSNKEIAHHLSIEVSTVKNHVHNILEKLGARRRSEAVAQVRSPALRARTLTGTTEN